VAVCGALGEHVPHCDEEFAGDGNGSSIGLGPLGQNLDKRALQGGGSQRICAPTCAFASVDSNKQVQAGCIL
jgi:hypothetical protein